MTETWGQFKSCEGKKFSALDSEFTKEVSKLIGGQDLTACFQCAKCSAGCPVSDKVNIQIHEVMRMLLFGLKEVLDTDMIWLCTTCYTCQERCPRDIRITDTILMLRTIAVHEGNMLQAHRKVSQLVLQYGHAVPINDAVKEKRVKLQMDVLPETVHKYPDSLEDIRTLLRSCEFDILTVEE